MSRTEHQEIQPIMTPALNQLRSLVAEKRPALDLLIQKYGNVSVAQYATDLLIPVDVETIDRTEDIPEVAYAHATRIYGENIAQHLYERLKTTHIINTGPHDGVDTFPLTYQGRLFGALGEQPLANSNGTVMQPMTVVMPCGGVPMNNVTKPMGLMVNETHKVNVFTNALKDVTVHVAPAFTEDMIAGTEYSITPNFSGIRSRSGVVKVDLSEIDRHVVSHVLQTIYKDPKILSQERYIDQAAHVNRKLWEQTFHIDVREKMPQLVSLEQESISVGLLERDLINKNSFMANIFFDTNLRQAVITQLEGIPGCWKQDSWKDVRPNGDAITRHGLSDLADYSLNISPEKRREDAERAMTHFFWGIDAKGKTYPLALAQSDGHTVLRRVDKLYTTEDVPFTPETILGGLQNQTLMPSLMVTFGLLQFARAYNCLGGFMQEEYLINMQHGLQRALEQTGRKNWAKKVGEAKRIGFAVGMPLVVTEDITSGNLRMAGPLDMIKHGGLTEAELAKIHDVTLEHEYLMGLPSIAQIIYGSKLDATLLSRAQEEVRQLWHRELLQI